MNTAKIPRETDNFKNYLQIDDTLLEAECLIMRNMLKEEDITAKVLKEHVKQDFCPNFYKLIQVALVLQSVQLDKSGAFQQCQELRHGLGLL